MEKNKVKEILINMMIPENESAVSHLLKSIDKIEDKDFHSILEQLNISEENIEQYLRNEIEKRKAQTTASEKFTEVNEWFSYGRKGNTIHMHLIPEDLRDLKSKLGDEAFYNLYKEQLEDFLLKLQAIFLEDPTIKDLFAVSPIFFNENISFIHESLGFDKIIEIDLNNKNDDMSIEQKVHFLKMFNKDGSYKRRVYYTKMTREKFLETKYESNLGEKSK